MTPELSDDAQMTHARARLGVLLGGKWTLESVLGVGGMAAVYSATHRNGKRVAIKVLHGALGNDEEVRKRFLQEGYAANTIQHEGAVSVLDDDVTPDGSAFIVMELLEGETLDQRWERLGRRWPVRDVVAMADQLLDVLAAAHAKSVVHRDIKPENLFLTKSGALKVLDFGIARVFEPRATRPSSTLAGMVMGTPAFMAPEQARGRWDEVDGRTDLWAVGATMFTLLSGRCVHEAPSEHERMILSATTRAPPLASAAPDAPPEVAALVDRALAFEREDRWADALSMQGAVRTVLGALGSEETIATTPGPRGAGTSDPTTPGATLAAFLTERDLRAAEVKKWRTSIAETQRRHGEARRRTAEAQARVDAGRTERDSLEPWLKRQVGTRAAAVEEARQHVRRQTLIVARRALVDRDALGVEFDEAREQIARLDLAAEAAARDVKVYEMAIDSYDPRAMRHGLLLSAALVLLLVVAPIVWRAVRVVAPPLPAQGTHQPAGH